MLLRAKIVFSKIVESISLLYEKPEAQSIAFFLLEDMFDVCRLDVLVNKEITISREKLEEACRRLAAGEPVQYVTRKAHFGELLLNVNANVLIPRPETEELARWIVERYAHCEGLNILDIGTGSGCLAIWLAKNLKKANLWAVDVSEQALSVAKENAQRYSVEITFQQIDILAVEKNHFPVLFDVIVSNPPYVLPAEKATMRKNVLDYEPHLALFAPQDNPFLFYEHILKLGKQLLRSGGEVFFEINEQFPSEISQLFQRYGYLFIECRKDFFEKPRMLRGTLS